jgi:hypothetical protein
MAAPLIIHEEGDRPDQQEVVLMLADFSFTPQILAGLKKGGSMPAMAKAAPGGASGIARAKGAGMRMTAAKPDLNDVTYDAFLANDRTLNDPEVIKVEPGGRVLQIDLMAARLVREQGSQVQILPLRPNKIKGLGLIFSAQKLLPPLDPPLYRSMTASE